MPETRLGFWGVAKNLIKSTTSVSRPAFSENSGHLHLRDGTCGLAPFLSGIPRAAPGKSPRRIGAVNKGMEQDAPNSREER